MAFEFADVFTKAARHGVPMAQAKGLALSFACEAPQLRLPGESGPLRGALHRVIHEAVELLDSGFIVLSADFEPMGSGQGRLTVRAGGVGRIGPAEVFEDCVDRLQLRPTVAPTHDRAACEAEGLCPWTGGRVTLTCMPSEGAVITLDMTCLCVVESDQTQTSPEDLLEDQHEEAAAQSSAKDTDLDGFTAHAGAPRDAGGHSLPTSLPPLRTDRPPEVLLAGSSETSLLGSRAMLEALGCVVRTARDGWEALEQCLRQAPDVLLTDLQMPLMNGVQATTRLRRLQRTGRMAPFPIVGITPSWSAQLPMPGPGGGTLECSDGTSPMESLRQELSRATTLH